MGAFYVNYTLRGTTQAAVVSVIGGRSASVTAPRNGCVVVFDQASDDQDLGAIAELASSMSRSLRCVVLATVNHDDDILFYQLYETGELTDNYDSSPNYFDAAAEPSPPVGGDPRRLCEAFGAADIQAVNGVLSKSSYDEDGYVFESERHTDLVDLLGIPNIVVGTTYADIQRGDLPTGWSLEDLVQVK